MSARWAKSRIAILSALSISLLATTAAYADPGDDDSGGPYDVIVENWQTFYPKVTALRSYNAYLATDKNNVVYYIPKLEDLPNLKNAVSECIDYNGKEHRFAAVYDGYFDQMCYEALVRKADGTYSSVPTALSHSNGEKARELQILGYDMLLTEESLSNIAVDGEYINASYTAKLFDQNNGYVDLQTAIMDIYKAVGQEKYDIKYMFTEDSQLTAETSPVQSEINLDLSTAKGIDNSEGKAWVFVTRTNPGLYWKQAANDGVVLDMNANVTDSDMAGTRESSLTLAQFCVYAYNIMHIYGEPVMTTQEEQLLMQVYGSYIPYGLSESEVAAVKNFIAKGIISPSKDGDYMQYTSPINLDYMLTLLMRIADVDSRETFKDIELTMDATMFDNGYYQAELTYESSAILDVAESKWSTRYSNYKDVYINMDYLEQMAKSANNTGIDMSLFVPVHLVFEGSDGTLFPLTTQVTTQSRKIYDINSNASYVRKTLDASVDGQLMQFCKSLGVEEMDNGRFLHLQMASFTVDDLLHGDVYNIYVVDDSGNKSSSKFTVAPGGGIYWDPGVSKPVEEEDYEYSNEEELQEIADYYEQYGSDIAESYAQSLIDKHPEWTNEEVDAALSAASDGTWVAANNSANTYYFKIANSNAVNSITVTREGSNSSVKLGEVLANTAASDGYHYIDGNTSELGFKYADSSKTRLQVTGLENLNAFKDRIKDASNSVTETTLAYCKQNEELMVSVNWLKNTNIITGYTEAGDGVLVLETPYTNVWLNKQTKYVLNGTLVMDVTESKDANEIWYKSETDIFVNYRAVVGWASDYIVLANNGGSISISTENWNTNGFKTPGHKRVKLMDYAKGKDSDVKDGLNTDIISFLSGDRATNVPLTGQYPYANYFVYMSGDPLDKSNDGKLDYLFVFKPANVKVNGKKITYDDTESRNLLGQKFATDISDDFDKVTVWAYELHRDKDPLNPKGIKYDSRRLYYYEPDTTEHNFETILENYFNTDNVLKGGESVQNVLPFYVDGTRSLRCFNYNAYVANDGTTTVDLDYGVVPLNIITGKAGDVRSQYTAIGTSNGVPAVSNFDISVASVDTFPTMVSPGLWLMNMKRHDANLVKQNYGYGKSVITFGTARLNYNKNLKKFRLGGYEFDDSKCEEFLQLLDTQNILIYSVSQLNAYESSGVVDGDEGTTVNVALPDIGDIDQTVDVIDWDEFTVTRLLQDFEFGIALAMIVVLNLMPRIALGLMLLMIMLGSIQNVKPWQVFCVKVFDPYKLLTFGKRDVMTFRAGAMFRNSIIAMAVFSLFMDGTIIHLYEWIMTFIAYLVGAR